MIRKLVLILVVSAAVIGGLQLFGGRDFSQLQLAWEKYQMSEDSSVLMSDVQTIFQGGRVRQPILPGAKYADQVMYRWRDELGMIHVSERKPELPDDQIEVIRLGDIDFQVQEGMSKEEIKQVLSKGDN